MRKYMLIGFLLGLGLVFSVGATFGVPNHTPEACEPNTYVYSIERYVGGVVVEELQICAQVETLEVVYSHWNNDVLSVVRAATDSEVLRWIRAANSDLDLQAEINFISDVEPGKNVVKILREWSIDYQTTFDNWETYTTTEILHRLKIKIGRDAKMADRLADLLVTLGY